MTDEDKNRVIDHEMAVISDNQYLKKVYRELRTIIDICRSDITPFDGKGNSFTSMSPELLIPIINGIARQLKNG